MSRTQVQPMAKRKKACRKTRYDDEFEARREAKKFKLRAYPCPHCAGWHLTSQEFRK